MAAARSKLPVAKEAAAKNFDGDRWAQYVRLSCIEIAAARGVSAQAAMSAAEVVDVARDLEKFVHNG